jgi:hypothetical protein
MYMPAAVGPLRGNNMALGVAKQSGTMQEFCQIFPCAHELIKFFCYVGAIT